VFLTSSGITHYNVYVYEDEKKRADPYEINELNQKIETGKIVRNVFFGVSMGSLAAGIVMFFIKKEVPVAIQLNSKDIMISYSLKF